MKKYIRPLLIACLSGGLLAACVPARQFEDMKAKAEKYEQENKDLKSKYQNIETSLTECEEAVAKAKKERASCVNDLDICESSLAAMTVKYDKLNEINNELMRKMEMLRAGNEAENASLSSELQLLQLQLQRKEDELRRLEKELAEERVRLEQLEKDLAARSARVAELEKLLAERDAKIKALQEKVKAALAQFEGKGLEIEMKNGKIYVKMEAKLLFASGSTKVGGEGKNALIKLAKALQGQSDLEIQVEGHTDTDKISSSSYPRDNWDLSVLRATSVVNIMVDNSTIEPKQCTAAGKSEFVPVDPSDKAKNRRIEIVLVPNLDELWEAVSE